LDRSLVRYHGRGDAHGQITHSGLTTNSNVMIFFAIFMPGFLAASRSPNGDHD
jgi:hypothetical protein